MSDIYVVWAQDADKAQARFEQITGGEAHRELGRGDFSLVQVEDLDRNKYIDSGSGCYCILFELG